MAELLAAAVSALGGSEREGQQQMAGAVERSLRTGEHLAVQAGTGTGKSLAYLVPAVRHAVRKNATVVISTSTIALQRQLVDRDLPRLADALASELGRRPTFAILKGRRNYLCLNKLHGGDENPEDELFDPFQISAMGRAVKRIHEWADDTETGRAERHRNHLGPDDLHEDRQDLKNADECDGPDHGGLDQPPMISTRGIGTMNFPPRARKPACCWTISSRKFQARISM